MNRIQYSFLYSTIHIGLHDSLILSQSISHTTTVNLKTGGDMNILCAHPLSIWVEFEKKLETTG